MGIKERQERDREAVRRSILDAARELFVSEGYRNVSIRKIAEKIEYSPAAIYGYFPSKDDIFYALAEEGFHLLHAVDDADKVDSARAGLEPLERLTTILLRLYEFSRQQPQYFELMFVDRSVPRISQAYERFAFARDRKNRLIAHIQDCIDGGALPSHLDAAVVFRVLTLGLLGAAMMRLSDRLGRGENADALARDVLAVTLRGLQSGITLESTFVDVDCLPAQAPATTEKAS
jgi:AcrR family transcriptional regulator